MNGSEDRRRLVSLLWDHLSAMENFHWKCCHFADKPAIPLQVIRDPLGRPHLLRGEYSGPAISFSEGGENIWAALCGDQSDIGIDVAATDEFQKQYPFHRVFNDPELRHALGLAGGELKSASALLWSIKEAAVKALGCAFHMVDPLQITVCPSTAGEGDGYTFPVHLSKKALMPFPIGPGRSLWARSFPLENMWLSIALLNRQSRCGHGTNNDTDALRRRNVDP